MNRFESPTTGLMTNSSEPTIMADHNNPNSNSLHHQYHPHPQHSIISPSSSTNLYGDNNNIASSPLRSQSSSPTNNNNGHYFRASHYQQRSGYSQPTTTTSEAVSSSSSSSSIDPHEQTISTTNNYFAQNITKLEQSPPDNNVANSIDYNNNNGHAFYGDALNTSKESLTIIDPMDNKTGQDSSMIITQNDNDDNDDDDDDDDDDDEGIDYDDDHNDDADIEDGDDYDDNGDAIIDDYDDEDHLSNIQTIYLSANSILHSYIQTDIMTSINQHFQRSFALLFNTKQTPSQQQSSFTNHVVQASASRSSTSPNGSSSYDHSNIYDKSTGNVERKDCF